MPAPAEPRHEDRSRVWALALLVEYERLQREHPPLRRLRLPNFAISAELRQTLGHWDSASRRLTLAARLFEHCRWEDVCAALRHELAHQIVAELYGQPHAPPHGPEFARACALLGIPASPHLTVDETAADPLHLAAKVRKLLALGQSPNHHEAELALAKAQELALRHNLARLAPGAAGADPAYGFRLFGPVFRRIPSHVWAIAAIVADFYFVLHISRTYEDAEGQRMKVLEFYGTRDNLAMAEYVFDFLLHQTEAEWVHYRRKQGDAASGWERLSFLNGVCDGFRRQLTRQRQHLAESLALVWLGDPGLKAFYRTRNPEITWGRCRGVIYRDAHAAGQAAGEKLRLRPGLPDAGATRSRGPRALLEG